MYQNRKRDFNVPSTVPTESNWRDVIINLVANSKEEKVISVIQFIRSQTKPFCEVLVEAIEMVKYSKIICFCPNYLKNKKCKLYKVVIAKMNTTNFCSECNHNSKRQLKANYAHISTTVANMPAESVRNKLKVNIAELKTSKLHIKILEVNN